MIDRPDLPEEAVEAVLAREGRKYGYMTREFVVADLEAAADALRKQGADEAEPKAGIMHPVDQAFYDLTVKERDAERARVDRLKAERDQALAKGAEEERGRVREAFDRIGGLPDHREHIEDFAERVECGDALKIAYQIGTALAVLDAPVPSEPEEGK